MSENRSYKESASFFSESLFLVINGFSPVLEAGYPGAGRRSAVIYPASWWNVRGFES